MGLVLIANSFIIKRGIKMKDYLERCNDIVKKVEEENIKNELKRSTTI